MKPIKRHPALTELSKDHHFGLLLSWKIRKAKEFNIETSRVAKYIIHFFETDLEYHFKEEEELLFTKLPKSDPMNIRANFEHKLMRDLIGKMKKDDSIDTIDEFSTILENHIRFEERELFDQIQESFSPIELDSIGQELKSRIRPKTTMWSDVFWEVQHSY